jgi:hypothetical protein
MTHQPGKGHRRKSEPRSKRLFQKRAAAKRAQKQKVYEEAKKRWNRMSEDARKMRPELHPDNFRP